MKNPIFKDLRPFPRVIMIALVALFSFFVFTALGIVTVLLIFNIPVSEIMNQISYSDTANINILKVLQITQSIGIFIIPAMVMAWLSSQHTWTYLGFKRKFDLTGFLLMLLVVIAAEPIVTYTGVLNQNMNFPDFLSGVQNWMADMETRAMDLTESFLHVTTLGGLLLNLLMVAILPGIGEELFFRSMLQKVFTKWFKNVHVAVIVTAFLFSALHMQFYGFIPRFLLGLLFGYIFVWTGNIWYPILAHMLHNAVPVIGYYLYSSDKSATSIEDVGTGENAWMWAVAGVVFLVIFIRLLKERFKSNEIKEL